MENYTMNLTKKFKPGILFTFRERIYCVISFNKVIEKEVDVIFFNFNSKQIIKARHYINDINF